MADNAQKPEPFSLKRWSQRKRAAARTDASPPLAPPAPAVEAPVAAAGAVAAANVVAGSAPASIAEAEPLPPVDSLTFESDYSAFMQPKIAEDTKRAALKKLFSDPSFNVMDGLDIYVGDYTQADPMPSGMLEKISTVYAMLDPVAPAQDEQAAAANVLPPTDAAPASRPDTSDASRESTAESAPLRPLAVTDPPSVGDPKHEAGNA